MKKIPLFICIILLSVFSQIKGQPAPARYGKIDMADLEMKVYAPDTTAEAVVLCDYGFFNPSTFDFQRLLRIKVLKKEGSHYVNNVAYINGLGAIKGITYNLVDGEIVETKLRNESIFKEEVREGRYRYRVTMPDVRVGSIVDINYSFPLLPGDWLFQNVIPVRWSELRIPNTPNVTFQKISYGFQPLYISESNRWVGKDMPALRTEPYVNSLFNYLTRMEIELSSYDFPGYASLYLTSSWEAVNKFLLDNKYFGVAMGMGLFLIDDAKKIKALNLSDQDKMKAACDSIKAKMKWNQVESLYTTADLAFVYRKGSGNSADVNLILVQLLKKLDFDAFPVALSTRENGIVSPAFPTIDKLNYVIAGVKYKDKTYYFDATEPCLPAGMLPFRALNGRGRTIDPDLAEWVDLAPENGQQETVYCIMKLDESGTIKGTITYTDNSYQAYYLRKDLKAHNSQDEHIREMESNFPGLTIESYTFENIDSIYKPVKEIYEVTLNGYADILGNMISVSPMLIEKMEDNPFKMEYRKYPIDYGHAIRNRFILNIEIPDGYQVSEIPKGINMVLPDKSGRFTYNTSVSNNNIQLMSNFDINKTVFTEGEYLIVKEFYNQIITKHKEVILLKKTI